MAYTPVLFVCAFGKAQEECRRAEKLVLLQVNSQTAKAMKDRGRRL
jgi:hypothetical protein